MYEVIMAIVGVILAIFGISYGVGQRQRAKDAEKRNEGLSEAYDNLVERGNNAVKEVADAAEANRGTLEEREQAKSGPIYSDDVQSRLDRLRK